MVVGRGPGGMAMMVFGVDPLGTTILWIAVWGSRGGGGEEVVVERVRIDCLMAE